MRHVGTWVGLAVLGMVCPLALGADGLGDLDMQASAVRDADRSPQADGGWFGIQLAPVPAALSSHLRLDEKGVMVRNLFRDSPADRAGIERYDVIVKVDGEDVTGGPEAFSRHVRSRRPGDELSLVLYRGGKQMEMKVPLGESPPRIDEQSLKYEDDPDVAQRRFFGLRGKILRPGPDGWVLDDLGDLPELDVERWFDREPEAHQPGEQGRGSADDIQESRRVDRDGMVTHVRRVDGRIEVRRYRSGTPLDKVEPKVYDNMDQLRKADPEAAELLESSPPPADHGYTFRWWRDHKDDVRKYEDDVRKYQEEAKKYGDALRDYFKRYREQGNLGRPLPPDLPRWGDRPEQFENNEPLVEPRQGGAPEARFEVHPDGSITVHVEDGRTQLDMTFPNERAFQDKAPKLHQRFLDAMKRVE